MKKIIIKASSDKAFALSLLGIPFVILFLNAFIEQGNFFYALGQSIIGSAIFAGLGYIVQIVLKLIFRILKIKHYQSILIAIFYIPLIITTAITVWFISEL